MKISWPNKTESESWEIEQFVYYYSLFHHDCELEIVEKGEAPDYLVCDRQTNNKFGVELTSVYKNDRSVPDHHIKCTDGSIHVHYSGEELANYTQRILDSIQSKINKAQKHYDQSHSLLLSVYVNEYISLYLRPHHLQKIVDDNSLVFDQMSPFVEMILWPLPSPDDYPQAMLIRPDS